MGLSAPSTSKARGASPLNLARARRADGDSRIGVFARLRSPNLSRPQDNGLRFILPLRNEGVGHGEIFGVLTTGTLHTKISIKFEFLL